MGYLLSELYNQTLYPNYGILSYSPFKDQTWDIMLDVKKI
jgi:hypothetical protein